MDAEHFDALTRTLIAAGSRRHALVLALSGALGVLGLSHADDAEAGRNCNPTCSECQICKKGKCKKTKQGKKKCKKGKCLAKANGTACSIGTCQSGACVCSFVGVQGVCTSQTQCCSATTGTVCASNFCRFDDLPVCCKPTGGTCNHFCDCCGAFSDCFGGICI
jgi:hypothetical protein